MTSALTDATSMVLLAASPNIASIVFVNECTLDTYHAASVHFPNYLESRFLAELRPEDFPKWTWDRGSRTFVETRPHLLTDEIMARSRLAARKTNVISRMTTVLNTIRNKVRTGVDFQETVYLTKKWQAERFRELHYDEEQIMEFPYVLQYADFAGISLRQAADDILLQAKLDEHYLAKTELIRLTYFRRVREATALIELNEIFEDFHNQCFSNTRV